MIIFVLSPIFVINNKYNHLDYIYAMIQPYFREFMQKAVLKIHFGAGGLGPALRTGSQTAGFWSGGSSPLGSHVLEDMWVGSSQECGSGQKAWALELPGAWSQGGHSVSPSLEGRM